MSTTTLPAHLQQDHQLHVVISTLSGKHTAQAYYDDTLKPLLDSYHLSYETHVTRSTQTIIELTRDVFVPNAVGGKHQTILLLSGDGGLIDIVDTVASQIQSQADTLPALSSFVRPVVSLIPEGTANALAWSAGIAQDALHVLVSGHTRTLPMFEITFSAGSRLVTNEGADREELPTLGSSQPKMYGAVVFSWGIHASLVARSDTKEYRKHGIERFKMAAYELLTENHAYDGKIAIQPVGSEDWQSLALPSTGLSVKSSPTGSVAEDEDGDQSNGSPSPTDEVAPSQDRFEAGKLSYLAATLVSNLEEKYLISPHTKPLSGSMYLISMPHVPAAAVAALTHLPYEKGQHISDERVGYQEIQGMRIDFLENGDNGQWRQVCIDGKIVEVEKGGWVSLRRMTNLTKERGNINSRISGGVVDLVVPDSA